MSEREPKLQVMDKGEIPPGLPAEGISFLEQLYAGKKPPMNDYLRIQFRGAGGYLNKAHVAMQRFDFDQPPPKGNRGEDSEELKKTRFIVINVLCPILYPKGPIPIEGLHQGVTTFRNILYDVNKGARLSAEQIAVIPKLVEFLNQLRAQYPALKEQFDNPSGSKK